MEDIIPSIEYYAWFGDERKKVWISMPNGTGGESWTVLINNYNVITILKRHGEYVYCYDNTKWELDDLQAIVDAVTEYTGEGFHQVRMRRDPTEKEYWARYGRTVK